MNETYKSFLTCSEEDKKLLMDECVKLYDKVHPEQAGMKKSQGFMIHIVINFFLRG